jgi:hypothetical protein
MENNVYFGGQTSHTCVVLDAFHGQLEFQPVPTWIHVILYYLRRQSFYLRKNLNFTAYFRCMLYPFSVLVVTSLYDNADL